jgi:hypothetical protein
MHVSYLMQQMNVACVARLAYLLQAVQYVTTYLLLRC